MPVTRWRSASTALGPRRFPRPWLDVRFHVLQEPLLKAVRVQVGIELREGEGVFGVVGVGDVEPALAELGVNAPALKHLTVLVDVLGLVGCETAQLAQVHLVGLSPAPLNLLLHLRRLLLMDGGIALIALHLLQAPCLSILRMREARRTFASFPLPSSNRLPVERSLRLMTIWTA